MLNLACWYTGLLQYLSQFVILSGAATKDLNLTTCTNPSPVMLPVPLGYSFQHLPDRPSEAEASPSEAEESNQFIIIFMAFLKTIA